MGAHCDKRIGHPIQWHTPHPPPQEDRDVTATESRGVFEQDLSVSHHEDRSSPSWVPLRKGVYFCFEKRVHILILFEL